MLPWHTSFNPVHQYYSSPCKLSIWIRYSYPVKISKHWNENTEVQKYCNLFAKYCIELKYSSAGFSELHGSLFYHIRHLQHVYCLQTQWRIIKSVTCWEASSLTGRLLSSLLPPYPLAGFRYFPGDTFRKLTVTRTVAG